MTALRIGDAAVTRCDITFPRRGVWCADVDLDTEAAPAGRVSVVVDGGPTWSGTVVSGGVSDPGLIRGVFEGPQLLTGGSFGLESSIFALVLCTGAGIVMAVLAHRRGHFLPPPWARR